MVHLFAGVAVALLLVVMPQAQRGTTIRIWNVGSPHTGETPRTQTPPGARPARCQPGLAAEHRCLFGARVRR